VQNVDVTRDFSSETKGYWLGSVHAESEGEKE